MHSSNVSFGSKDLHLDTGTLSFVLTVHLKTSVRICLVVFYHLVLTGNCWESSFLAGQPVNFHIPYPVLSNQLHIEYVTFFNLWHWKLLEVSSQSSGMWISQRCLFYLQLSYQVVDAMIWLGIRDMINEFRKKRLKLRPVTYLSPSYSSPPDLPYGYIWSPHLVPKPKGACFLCYLSFCISEWFGDQNCEFLWFQLDKFTLYYGLKWSYVIFCQTKSVQNVSVALACRYVIRMHCLALNLYFSVVSNFFTHAQGYEF